MTVMATVAASKGSEKSVLTAFEFELAVNVRACPEQVELLAEVMVGTEGSGLTVTRMESLFTQPLLAPPELSVAVTTYLVVSIGDTVIGEPVWLPGAHANV